MDTTVAGLNGPLGLTAFRAERSSDDKSAGFEETFTIDLFFSDQPN